MRSILKKGLIILGVYIIFIFYLFVASNRIERLDEENNLEKKGVVINIFE